MQAEEIHAQAAPAPEGASGEPEEAQVPDEAQPRRAASAPMPEVGQGAEAFTVGSFANAFILGVNAAFQQGQVIAAQACWPTLCRLTELCTAPSCLVCKRLQSRTPPAHFMRSLDSALALRCCRSWRQTCKCEALGAGAGRRC